MPKTYLITACSGIGAETARMLAKGAYGSGPNARLFIAGRNPERCRVLKEELEACGVDADYRAGDLTEPNFAPELVAACHARFGRLDAVFNVAGISGRRFGDGPVHECTEEGWNTTLQTNVTTQYRVCREAVRLMLDQDPAENGQRGVILNMASILGLHPEPRYFDTVAYAASKGAIIAMTRSMASSYARRKIRVNAVAPALVRTPMSARASEDRSILEFMKVQQPLIEDVISTEDAAAVCVHLLSDASHAITGQVIAVDAGWSVA